MKILESIEKFSHENRIAAILDNESLSYKELNEQSESFAAYLLNNFKDKKPVLIYGNKEHLFLCLMMGALKAGRAYIPVDISFPVDRVKQIVIESGVDIIINLTDTDLGIEGVFNTEYIKAKMKEFENISVEKSNHVKDDENAYILFTSGSTGKPKGVQISSNNLDSFVNWFKELSKTQDNEGLIMNAVSYSFDLSVTPLYIGLCSGKTLYSIPKSKMEDFKLMFDAVYESDVNTWVSTPSFCDILLKDENYNEKTMPNLEKFIFSGEVLAKKTAEELKNRFPNAMIINGYGPTEGTVFISASIIDDSMLKDERAFHVGCPMSTTTVRIVDENGNDVKEREKGELIITGDSISKGYLNNEEMNKKSFFKINENGKIINGYRTGDIGYFDNGVIHFCGRADFQIKLYGYRIELEDIENNIRKVSNVKNVVVVPIVKDGVINNLMAYITLKENNGLTSLKNSIAIKNELKNLIPSYMIPRTIKIIDDFPRNTSGKIDRKQLMGDNK